MNQTSTILIVDDEPAGRDTLEALLFKEGYHLLFAGNGPDALAQARTSAPDLVLLDVMMPGMDGFEVCRELRADSNLSEVPIIMVTALDDRDSRMEGIEAGADDFITKPFDRMELRARIRTVLRLNRYRRLIDERARFEWVIEQAEDGYVMISPHDTITYANKQGRSFLNLSETENLKDAQYVFLERVQKYFQCEPQEAWETWPDPPTLHPERIAHGPHHATGEETGIARYLVCPETPSSHAQWVEVERVDMPGGTAEGYLIRLRDVTTQMSRQRQMWTFHALIAHKLGTPLTGLINSLHLLNDKNATLSPEETEEFSHIAFESAQRLRQQIQNIRNYMRTPDLAQPGEACSVSCIQRIIEQIQHDMELDTVQVQIQGEIPDQPLVISRQAVELVLRQIVENAKKFHPSLVPTVEIVVSWIPTGYVSVCVTDDGVSLSPEQLVGVWVPYYQAEKGFSGEVKGMGLGLAMVAALLWSVGGHYQMRNRDPGPGIEVTLLIPVQEPVSKTEVS